MAKANLKVVDIKDYLRAHPALRCSEIEAIITEQRTSLRILDAEAMNLFSTRHKEKDAQVLNDTSLKLESNLVQTSDWLEDRITETNSEEAKVTYRDFIKQCDQLTARNERTKKNISNDMASCRHVEGKEAIDPVKAGTFIVGIPLALTNLARLLFNAKPEEVLFLGRVGFVVGVFLAFHHQAKNIGVRTGEALANSPQKIRSLEKHARNSAFTAAVALSVAIEEAKGLETNYPERSEIKPKMFMAAQL